MRDTTVVENPIEKYELSVWSRALAIPTHTVIMSGKYDLVIVGGISGASLLYTTAKFTDIDLDRADRKGIGDRSDQLPPHEQLTDPPLRGYRDELHAREGRRGQRGSELLAGYLENTDRPRDARQAQQDGARRR